MTDDRPETDESAGTDSRASLDERVRDLHRHLEATETLPIDRRANRWIGEAEAVAADLVDAPADEATVRRRAGHVVDLLEEVEEPGSEEAADRVESALAIARAVAENEASDSPD